MERGAETARFSLALAGFSENAFCDGRLYRMRGDKDLFLNLSVEVLKRKHIRKMQQSDTAKECRLVESALRQPLLDAKQFDIAYRIIASHGRLIGHRRCRCLERGL